MILFTEGLQSEYEVEMLCRMLFPGLTLAKGRGFGSLSPDEDYVAAIRSIGQDGALLKAEIRLNGEVFAKSEKITADADVKEYIRALSRMIYQCALQSGADELRWGTLTGVRPIKLFHTLAGQGLSEQAANAEIKRRYLVSDGMLSLAQQVRRAEHEIHKKSSPMGFSLYISIPFCPQRCSYCSFVSQSVEKLSHLIEPYVEQLCKEIAELGEIAGRIGLKLHTIYFGGGTPTTLSAKQLTRLFEQIERSFDLKELLEYTVEAGRPDTIDADKLLAMKRANVTRLSVNPQTMNDEVLQRIGRRHGSADVISAFELARKAGFDNINMDLIAGLPDDTPDSFEKSLRQVLSLSPDNITVHTLTLKRSSTLVEQGAAAENLRRQKETAQMVDTARELITQAGYLPYYLYRQKNTVGSLDNTGYAKPGREGLYNVFIMDETHTILAAGAGAVTKLKAPFGDRIERIYNFKYPTEYLARYEALEERRAGIERFYRENTVCGQNG